MQIVYMHHADRDRSKGQSQDNPITKLGKKEAQAIGKIIKARKLQVKCIYTGTFLRYHQTVEQINKNLKVPVIIDSRLNEHNWDNTNNEKKEKSTAYEARTHKFLKDVISKHNNDDAVLCMTSGLTLNWFATFFLKSAVPIKGFQFMHGASISPVVFVYDKGQKEVYIKNWKKAATNEKLFTGKAEIYHRIRPRYPEESIDYVLSLLPKNPVVADVGSGTGILTEPLLKRGCTVYAVEPNKDMRKLAENRLTPLYKKSFISVDGTAENTSLEDGKLDMVIAAQALHWFDIEKFAIECKRILKPTGKIAILFNNRVGKIRDEYTSFLQKRFPSRTTIGKEENNEHIAKLFGKNYIKKPFKSQVVYDKKQFVERGLSSSYTPTPKDKDYDSFVAELEAFFKKYEKDGNIIFDDVTNIYHKQ